MKPSILLKFVLTALIISPALAGNVNVYLLGGQSNMQGIGFIKDLTPEQQHIPAGTYFWNNATFEPLELGETKTSGRVGELGPEVGFAQNIQTDSPQPEKNTYIIKHYASGMPLHHGWNRNKWLGGKPAPKRVNFYPGTSASDPNQGVLYRNMITRFQKGIAALKAQGHTPVIRGFL